MISKGRSSIYESREYIEEYGCAVLNSMKCFSEEMREKIEEKSKKAHNYALAFNEDPIIQKDVEEASNPDKYYEERQLNIVNRTILCMLFTYYDNTLLYLAKQYGLNVPPRKGPRSVFNPLIDAGLFPITREDRNFISHLLRYIRNVIIHGERDPKEERRASKCVKELSLNITFNDWSINGVDMPFLQNALERLMRVLMAIDNTLIVLNNVDGENINRVIETIANNSHDVK